MERVIPPSSFRTGADRCPGLLRPHSAADGAVVRVRLPGGMITAAALADLAHAADTFGNGELQLTSRANVQLRGVPTDSRGDVPGGLVDSVRAAGLLPSERAELIRNILCSPMTGRVGGFADLRPLVDQLDARICASPGLTGLSGRFVFGLDDGSGDIAVAGCDLGIVATSDRNAFLVAGGESGPLIGLDAAADRLVALAHTFLTLRGSESADCWHVAELPGGGAALLAEDVDDARSSPITRPPAAPRYGVHRQSDGRSLLSLVVPLGRLTPSQLRAVVDAARSGSGELVVTPWNGLLLTDLPMATDSPELATVVAGLAAAGLPSSPDSGWIGVSACTGAPGCARAAGPTGPVAARIANENGRPAGPVHVVACERRCGAPSVEHVEVMIEPVGQVSRRRPARTADGRSTRRTASSARMSLTAAAESA